MPVVLFLVSFVFFKSVQKKKHDFLFPSSVWVSSSCRWFVRLSQLNPATPKTSERRVTRVLLLSKQFHWWLWLSSVFSLTVSPQYVTVCLTKWWVLFRSVVRLQWSPCQTSGCHTSRTESHLSTVYGNILWSEFLSPPSTVSLWLICDPEWPPAARETDADFGKRK